MSLLTTKPSWFRGNVIATERGWVNPLNNEVLVAIGNLKVMLEAEFAASKPVELKLVEVETNVPDVIIVKENKMENKKPATKKTKVIAETTEKTVPAGQQLIAEVIEHDLDKKIIAE
jgi:hypothetical protein